MTLARGARELVRAPDRSYSRRPVSEPEVLGRYRAALTEAWRRGIAPLTAMYGRELEIAPELIYVELWAETGEERERVVPVEEDRPRRRARVPDLLAEQGARGLLVLGEAGAGKTALVSWLATRALAEGKRVPLVLPLASLALRLASEPGADLVAVAAEIWARHGAPGLAPVFSAALERGEAWILFDGLDEAGGRRQRQEVAQRIADFVRGSGANAWLVTSRPGEERDSPLPGPAPLRATLCAWEENEVERALLGWCRALERWRVGSDGDEAAAGERARRLRDQIFADGALRELASRPLSLAMLVLIERAHQKLPEHRVLLCRAFADELLARRPGGATRDEAVEFLIELALWIHQKHPLGRAHAETLTPAYDLVSTELVIEGDDFALTLGGKRSRFKRADWLSFARYAGVQGAEVELARLCEGGGGSEIDHRPFVPPRGHEGTARRRARPAERAAPGLRGQGLR